MNTRDRQERLKAALAAVRDCADTMESQAASLLKALPELSMDEGLRATALALSAGLRDASGRVMFELALLQTEMSEGKADVATAVQRLSGMDALMMRAVADMAEAADELENAAERDEVNEPAFVRVIEATGVLMQGLEKARAATEGLRAVVPQSTKQVRGPGA